MLSKQRKETIQERQQLSMAFILVFLMLASSLLAIVQGMTETQDDTLESRMVQGGSVDMVPAQSLSLIHI